jgi:hypothetical protein
MRLRATNIAAMKPVCTGTSATRGAAHLVKPQTTT